MDLRAMGVANDTEARAMVVEDEGLDVRRVLLIEDEPAIAAALALYLELEGYEVRAVGTSHEARALIEGERFDAVVSDLCLGASEWSEGLGSCRLVRWRQPWAVLLVLSACDLASVEATVREIGARAYLRKPISLREVARTLSRFLETGASAAL